MKTLLTLFALCLSCHLALMAQSVEVYYFHGKQRCVTCNSIQQHTQELINERYADAVKSGKLKLSIVDFSTNSGKALAKDYKVSYSSLLVVAGNECTNLTHMGFKYAKSNATEFKKLLSAEIDKRLQSK